MAGFRRTCTDAIALLILVLALGGCASENGPVAPPGDDTSLEDVRRDDASGTDATDGGSDDVADTSTDPEDADIDDDASADADTSSDPDALSDVADAADAPTDSSDAHTDPPTDAVDASDVPPDSIVEDARTDPPMDAADADVDPGDAGDAGDVDGGDDAASAICGDGIVAGDEECDDGDDNADAPDACRTTCLVAVCGDGITDTDEACDDGNDVDDDECHDDCTEPVCGDERVGGDEECDDGNDIETDGCTSSCISTRPEGCGDGVVEGDEECDDGNLVDDDACTNHCRVARCGDGILHAARGEECDDGNGEDADECTNRCTIPRCGDGIVQAGERCDDGPDNADDVADACRTDCTPPMCGDGVRDTGEVCDDGDDDDTDACTTSCEAARCGDGIVQPPERCDDGERNSDVVADRCRTTCVRPACGDGTVDAGEACDDGNDDDTDACTNACAIPVCGDGIVHADRGEACDDGNAIDDDECTNACATPACGDGIVHADRGEVCDDGNDIDDDACSNACRPARCGDGIVHRATGEECDDGNDVDGDACTNACTVAVCGDGILGPDEACDDGNVDDVDDCSNRCTLPECGDGVRAGDEVCDDGNDIETDACTSRCEAPRCGDGIVQAMPELAPCRPVLLHDTLPVPPRIETMFRRWGYDPIPLRNNTAALAVGPYLTEDPEWLSEHSFILLWRDSRGTEPDDAATFQAWINDGNTLFSTGYSSRTAGRAPGPALDIMGLRSIERGSNIRRASVFETPHRVLNGPWVSLAPGSDLPVPLGNHYVTRLLDGAVPLMGWDSTGTKLSVMEDVGDGGGTIWFWNGNHNWVDWSDASDPLWELLLMNIVADACGRPLEGCDEGEANADVPGATCRTYCQPSRCGDGIVDPTEECDDGNTTNDDSCTNACTTAVCGDGIHQAGEECDDGNDDESDRCTNLCRRSRCGDGIVSAYAGEEVFETPRVMHPEGYPGYVCDDGSTCPEASCDVSVWDRASEHGICQALGFDRAVHVTWGSSVGYLDYGYTLEADFWHCDDYECESDPPGRFIAQQCYSGEMLESITCGGGRDEECDDGAANSDTAPGACRTSCLAAYCGDGVTDAGEACDDGNDNDLDGCTNTCTLPVCGDGVAAGDEQCDDGNDVSTDACTNTCTLARCGDGVVQTGEACDDGNDVDDDGCTNTCAAPTCGDGVVDPGEGCDDGNDFDDDLCTNRCLEPVCGDGVRQLLEMCDDRNRVDDDACTNTCRRGPGWQHYAWYGTPWDLDDFNLEIARVLRHACEHDHVPDPIIAVLSNCVDEFVEAGASAPGGPYLGHLAATIAALEMAGVHPDRIMIVENHDEVRATMDEWDVLLFPQPDRCGMTSTPETWDITLREVVETERRIVTVSGHRHILNFIKTVAGFGTGIQVAPYRSMRPTDHPFWSAGATMPGRMPTTLGVSWSRIEIDPIALDELDRPMIFRARPTP